MASMMIKAVLGDAASPQNVAILFAVVTVLIVSLFMYFFSKDCGGCAFTMLKRFAMWGAGAAVVGYLVGMGIQASPTRLSMNMGMGPGGVSLQQRSFRQPTRGALEEPVFTLQTEQTGVPASGLNQYRGAQLATATM